MKKFLIVLVIIVVIIILFFLFRGCDVETKTQEEPTEEATEEILDLDVYREPFIYANTEFTCQIVEDPSLTENEETLKLLLDGAYKKYGFPVDDNETMIEILGKFENDEEIISTIKANVNECKPS